MEAQTVITLLTITVVLLSVVIITLLVLAIWVLVKIKSIAQKADNITSNLVAATDWLVPSRVFRELAKVFRKNKV